MPVPQNSTVRWFHSSMPGAPQINAQAGDVIAILDACLVTGFDTRAPDGDKITVLDEVATVHISGGHAYEKHAVIEITGATPSSLNDVWRITSATATTLTFACPGISNGTATGSINVKRAAPGYWEKAYSDGTTKGAYRSTHEDASGCYLRIDNTGTGSTAAIVRGYESMTGIDDGTHPFPTVAQNSVLTWRPTSTTTVGQLPRPWAVVADSHFFYFLAWMVPATYAHTIYQFGDVARLSEGDYYPAVITGHTHVAPGNQMANTSQYLTSGEAGCWFARDLQGIAAGPKLYRRHGNSITQSLGYSGPFPNPATNGLLLTGPVYAGDDAGLRGVVPGIAQSMCFEDAVNVAEIAAGLGLAIYEADENLPYAVLLAKIANGFSGVTTNTIVGFDIEGPWR